jgi:hypothetical protein
MLKILRKLGKELWKEDIKTEEVLKVKAKRRKTSRKSREELADCFLHSIQSEIAKSGYRSIRVSTLMKRLGIAKRSDKSVAILREQLRIHGLYALPEFSMSLSLNEVIRIYNFPVTQKGELFRSERELETFVDQHRLYEKLGISHVDRQYSPNGTKDRLDFLGAVKTEGSNEVELIVLELKNGGGGKSAVEQVLRYSGLLKFEFGDKKIRKILVTGIQNYETALAIAGMKQDERDNFEWYLYDYNSAQGSFEFIRVNTQEFGLLPSVGK